jgi:hypothetical protein
MTETNTFIMEKKFFFSLIAGCVALGMVACNNSSNSTSSTDSTSTDSLGSMANTSTSTSNYAARADTVKTNVAAGNYINPKTGKAYTNINVDQNTGALTDESGAPIRRYVDKRTWWVYDTDKWDTIGSARMQGNNLMYRDANGKWVTYDKAWTDDMNNSSMNNQSSDSNMTTSDNPKIKVSDKGNKIKIKNTDNKH